MQEINYDGSNIYIAIDLKSFYASVECVERGLDPLKTNLVVADTTRTEKTICLAVSPSLKAYGISSRARLFEVVEAVKRINAQRLDAIKKNDFSEESYDADTLKENPNLKLAYIAALPRMSLYLEYSRRIRDIYLRYVSIDDMHIYSVDEVFIDITHYLNIYKMTPYELARKMIKDVLSETGITATAGIGTNMYLCKIAMDILAKHVEADEDGVRIAELDEMSYRRKLWTHTPVSDFWRVGRGYERKLHKHGLYTMGDIAKCSVGREDEYYNEELLYKLFGVNAELLIDHAWGYESTTIADIKAYRPKENSISAGQVLKKPYTAEKGEIIVWEMTDLLVLDLVKKGYLTNKMVLEIGYDIENLKGPKRRALYKGEVSIDHYGRAVPAKAHGSINLSGYTSSSKEILDAVRSLYNRIVDHSLLIRRVTISAQHILPKDDPSLIEQNNYKQLSFFDMQTEALNEENKDKEERLQKAVLAIKEKYGKNAILKGTNLCEDAMTIERNNQIGGHKA